MIEERFGKEVADIVLSVTETNKDLPWEERKAEALKHIKTFSNNSLFVKSADILSNTTELIEDYKHEGEEIFTRFNASKDKILQHYLNAINTIINRWSENPLIDDLRNVAKELQSIK